MNCWNFYGSTTCPYNGAVEFWLITMGALLYFLNWVVSELEYYYYLKRAGYLCEDWECLTAHAQLNEIRESPEYRNLH
jgi:hypothetical protein